MILHIFKSIIYNYLFQYSNNVCLNCVIIGFPHTFYAYYLSQYGMLLNVQFYYGNYEIHFIIRVVVNLVYYSQLSIIQSIIPK